MDALYEILGVIFGWCWCKNLREFIWRLLYWLVLEFCGKPPQNEILGAEICAGGFWSGFMSEVRDLSWDRKSCYGKK